MTWLPSLTATTALSPGANPLRMETKGKREGASEPCHLEFTSADGKNRLRLILTSAGNLKLAIRRNRKKSSLTPTASVPAGAPGGAAIGEAGAYLTANRKTVGQDPTPTVRPWDRGLRGEFLGRGREGGFSKGGRNDVTVYSVPAAPC